MKEWSWQKIPLLFILSYLDQSNCRQFLYGWLAFVVQSVLNNEILSELCIASKEREVPKFDIAYKETRTETFNNPNSIPHGCKSITLLVYSCTNFSTTSTHTHTHTHTHLYWLCTSFLPHAFTCDKHAVKYDICGGMHDVAKFTVAHGMGSQSVYGSCG